MHRERVAARVVLLGGALGLLGWLVITPPTQVTYTPEEWAYHRADFLPSLLAIVAMCLGMAVGAAARAIMLTGQRPWPLGPGAPWTLPRRWNFLAVAIGIFGHTVIRIGFPAELPLTSTAVDPVVVAFEPMRVAGSIAFYLVAAFVFWEFGYHFLERKGAVAAPVPGGA